MNTNTGYSKKTLGDSYVLLSGGGHKTLSEFIGTLSYSNNKITYTKANDSTSYDLVTIPTVPEYDLYVGASNGTSTAALSTNGNVHLILKKGSNYTRYKIKGYTNISVTSTADEIKITGPNLSGYLTSADLSGYLTSLYTTGLYVGATETQENSQTSNGNTYIKLFDDSTRRANIKISGSTNVSVSSNSSGDITITGPDLSGYLNDGSLYVLKAGDTMTGILHLLANQYTDSAGTGSLDLANSDIYGVNSIKFADLSDTAAEGLQWYRDSTHVDSIWVKSGVIYFTPNRAWNGTGTNYTVYHSGNLPAYPTKASWNYDDVYLKLTGGTLYNTSSDTPLNIKSNGNNAYIAFQKSDGTSIGSIGVKNDNRAYFYDGSSTHKLAYYSEIPSDYLTASDLSNYLTSSDLKTYSAVLTDTNAKTTNVTGGLFYNLLEKTGDGSYSVIKSVKFVGDGTGISVSSDANGVITITNSKPDLNHNVTTSLYLGGSSSTSDVALTTNGNTYLILKEGSSYTRKQIKGYNNISVTNTTSEIKISGPDLSGFLTTHYTTGLYVGATEAKSNALTTNGNTYIKLFDDDSRRANIKISGSTNVSVASDSSGNITITGPNLSGYLTSSDLNGYLTSSDLKSYSAALTDTNAKTSDVAGGTYYNLLEKTGSGNYSVVKSIKFVAGTGISLSHTTAGELKITNSSPNSHQSVSNSNPELKWNTTHTIGTVGGTSLQFTVGNNEGTSDFTDGTELLSSYASNDGFAVSGTGNKVIYRRKASSMYNYLKGKFDLIYLTSHQSLSNYYNKTEIDNKLSSILDVLIVLSLPTISNAIEKTLYLMANSETETNELYKEYIKINKGTSENPDWVFEKLGGVTLNVSNFVTAIGISNLQLTWTKGSTALTPIDIDAKTILGKGLNSTYGGILHVKDDGVMEAGRYLDFHTSSSDTRDFAVRLQASNTTGTYMQTLPSSSGTIALTSDLSSYVKLDSGANEQTIKSSIGSLSKGIINLWRNSGDHYTFLGFSNGTTETYLGGIGFKSQSDKDIYYKHTNGNYYPILTSNNVSSYIDSRYVLKSGDTMTGDLRMDTGGNTELGIKFITRRDVSNGTGWAFAPIHVGGSSNSEIFNIAIFGNKQEFKYAYFGNGAYDSWTNTRMYPNGDIYSRQYLLKDTTGFLYPAAYDNGTNLWIGATQTAAQHHRGQTFISSGYNGTSGNSTIKVSVPNATNTDASNYDVLHSGNWTTYIKAFRYYPLTSSSNTDFNFPDGHDCPGGLYYLNNSSMVGTQSNRPVSFGMLLNFECQAGHLQLASTANLNDLRFRSYWWTNNNQSSGFPGYPDWTTILHSGNTYISNGTITINGSSITPMSVNVDFMQHHTTKNEYDSVSGLRVLSISNPSSGIFTNKWGSGLLWCNYGAAAPGTADNKSWYNQLIGLTDDNLYFRTRLNGGNWTSIKRLAFASEIPDVSKYAYIGFGGTSLASNTDLNTILTAGTYYAASGTISTTFSNRPSVSGNVKLWHICNTGTDGGSQQWGTQVLMDTNKGKFYSRSYENGTFGAWHTAILDNPGAVEQTIQSSIGSLDKGVINLWRSNGNYYTFLGFSNSSSNTYLGGIGFTAQGNTTIYYRNTSGSVFPLLHPDSNGNLTITGSYYANSDIKLKNILSRESYSSNYFATLPIIKFTWNNRNDSRVHLGTIALDVEFDFPELVTKDENGYKSLDYATLGTIGVISLAKEIVELRKEINELKLKLYDNNLYN